MAIDIYRQSENVIRTVGKEGTLVHFTPGWPKERDAFDGTRKDTITFPSLYIAPQEIGDSPIPGRVVRPLGE